MAVFFCWQVVCARQGRSILSFVASTFQPGGSQVVQQSSQVSVANGQRLMLKVPGTCFGFEQTIKEDLELEIDQGW